ncbi:MAG: hypothetical protein HY553_02645 [Elusimicrobia bacterium]|nr:hypothetical protein [Elusimicrobiota bacterium]
MRTVDDASLKEHVTSATIRARASIHEPASSAAPGVADDAVCEILREALTDEGYAVATVPHGAAALDLVKHPAGRDHLRSAHADHGWMVVRRAVSPHRKTRGVADPPQRPKDVDENAKRLRASDFIGKPFELSELLAKIERCIAQS